MSCKNQYKNSEMGGGHQYLPINYSKNMNTGTRLWIIECLSYRSSVSCAGRIVPPWRVTAATRIAPPLQLALYYKQKRRRGGQHLVSAGGAGVRWTPSDAHATNVEPLLDIPVTSSAAISGQTTRICSARLEAVRSSIPQQTPLNIRWEGGSNSLDNKSRRGVFEPDPKPKWRPKPRVPGGSLPFDSAANSVEYPLETA